MPSLQFIELFDEDLVTLPKTLPSWFARDSATIVRHAHSQRHANMPAQRDCDRCAVAAVALAALEIPLALAAGGWRSCMAGGRGPEAELGSSEHSERDGHLDDG